MELRDYLQVLRAYWVSIVILALVGLGAGAAYAYLAPPVYTAKATVYLSVNSGNSAGDLLQGTNYAAAQARSFVQMATMAQVLEPAIDKLGGAMSYDELAAKITATIPTNTQLIVISASDDQPVRSAEIAQYVAESLVDTIAQMSPTTTSKADVVGSIVDPAVVPSGKTSPKLLMSLGLGLVAGLVVGVGLAFARRMLDRRIHTAADVADLTDTPVIATIPQDPTLAKQPVPIMTSPTSLTSEGYRQLRTSLMLYQVDSERPYRFIVTSSTESEGKTTTAVNIAFALAEDRGKVLLVEADLRRPQVGALLGLETGAGLTSVLVGRVDLSAVVQSLGQGRPDVLVAGTLPLNPAGWLASARMRAFVETVSNEYDAVVFDTAPTLPVADTAALLPHVGAMVMVAAAEKVTTTQLLDSLDLVGRTGADVIGIVLNGEHRRRPHSSYYGYPRRGGDAALDEGGGIITESPVDQVQPPRRPVVVDARVPAIAEEVIALTDPVVTGAVADGVATGRSDDESSAAVDSVVGVAVAEGSVVKDVVAAGPGLGEVAAVTGLVAGEAVADAESVSEEVGPGHPTRPDAGTAGAGSPGVGTADAGLAMSLAERFGSMEAEGLDSVDPTDHMTPAELDDPSTLANINAASASVIDPSFLWVPDSKAEAIPDSAAQVDGGESGSPERNS